MNLLGHGSPQVPPHREGCRKAGVPQCWEGLPVTTVTRDTALKEMQQTRCRLWAGAAHGNGVGAQGGVTHTTRRTAAILPMTISAHLGWADPLALPSVSSPSCTGTAWRHSDALSHLLSETKFLI